MNLYVHDFKHIVYKIEKVHIYDSEVDTGWRKNPVSELDFT